jgi:hypothetical protein
MNTYDTHGHLSLAAEPNPSSLGAHAHAWSRGDVPTDKALNARAEQVGIGRCDVSPVRRLGYVTKTATWNEASLSAFRAINGSELAHGRSFWHNPVTGAPLQMTVAATAQRHIDLAEAERLEAAGFDF